MIGFPGMPILPTNRCAKNLMKSSPLLVQNTWLLSLSCLSDSLSTIAIGQKGRKNVSRDFRFNAVNVPDGWNVYLQSAYLQREILDVDGSSYTYADSVHLVFAVTIPEGDRGARLLTLSVGKGEKSKIIQINIRVINP
jgi:hypothetical protein